MVRTVDALEARGLVVRRPSPTDRRAYAVEITDEGRAVFREASKVAREVGEGLLACLDEPDRAVFHALLERFVAGERPE
jgi:MarR family transcriptional regulator, lower aerobic nicotinate degradation pathway regulator